MRQEHLLKTALTCKMPADVWQKEGGLPWGRMGLPQHSCVAFPWRAVVYQGLWSKTSKNCPKFRAPQTAVNSKLRKVALLFTQRDKSLDLCCCFLNALKISSLPQCSVGAKEVPQEMEKCVSIYKCSMYQNCFTQSKARLNCWVYWGEANLFSPMKSDQMKKVTSSFHT